MKEFSLAKLLWVKVNSGSQPHKQKTEFEHSDCC